MLMQSEATKKRFGGLGVVIFLHMLIAYGLIVGTAHDLVAFLRPPMDVEIVTEKKAPPPDMPPPKLKLVKLQPPPLLVPLLEVRVEQPVQTNQLYGKPMGAEPVQPSPVVRNTDEPPSIGTAAEAWLDTASCALPPYPWQLSNREQGTVMLLLLVDVDGQVVDSRVAKSSGVKLLDETARVGMAQCKYKPGTLDGKPQKSWKKLRFIWQLPF